MSSHSFASLPEEVLRFAEAQVAAGHYASVEEVLCAGVEALQARQQAESEWLAYAQDKWREGVAASERGESTEMNATQFAKWLDDC